ncbi:MAG: carboxypeptidase regulatory-like domain-containing protein [Acidobacteriota bacterium]
MNKNKKYLSTNTEKGFNLEVCMKYQTLSGIKYMLFTLIVIVSNGMLVYSQIATGGIQGQVSDIQKALIGGAEVTVKNINTGSETTTVTDENGRFRITTLQPGIYNVTITIDGFKKTRVREVSVKLGVEIGLDVVMEVADAQDQVIIVMAGDVVIESESAQISANFDTNRVVDLPNLAGGGIDGLALLTPGVVSTGDVTSSTDNGTQISSNGGRGRSNNFTIDGQDNNDIILTGPAVKIDNPELVQEFQIITNNFSAEYGQAGSAIVNIITKGGTNTIHGTGSYFYRNRKLFDTLDTLERRSGKKEADPLLSNIFGFTLSGPLKKDRAFFFLSYQGERQAQTRFVQSGANALTPTPTGLQTLIKVVDANIANLLKVAAPFNQPIGNPIIQPDVPTRMIQIKGVPVEFGAIQRNIPSPFEENLFSGRIDVNWSDKLRINSRYIYQKSETGNKIGNSSNGFVGDVASLSQQLGTSIIYQLSANAINELNLNYSRQRIEFGGSKNGNLPSADKAEQAITSVTGIAGFIGLGPLSSLPQGRINDNYQLINNFSLTAGRHSIKTGLDIKLRLTDSNFLPNQNGSFRFSNLARFADNNPTSATISVGNKILNFRELDQSYFFQDNLRLGNNLTLNLGVRYENSGQPINLLNRITTRREADAATAIFNTALPLELRIFPRIKSDNNNFAPRIGFAYTPNFAKAIFGENRTVLRGGYAISYDLTFYNILINVATGSPALLAATITGVPKLLPADPSGPGVRAALLTRLPLGRLDPRVLNRTTVAKDLHSPYTQQFSFGLQRLLGNNAIVEARYVGTHSVGQFQSINTNPRFDSLFQDFPQFVPAGIRPSANGRLIAEEGLDRRRINGASSIYHSLQTSLNVSVARELTFSVAYTFSKQIDNASEIFSTFGGGSTIDFAQDPFNTSNGERALGAYDVRNNFALSFTYDIPAFREQKGIMGKLLGGFQLSGTYFARPGQYYTPTQIFFGSPYTDTTFNLTFTGSFETLRPFLSNSKAPITTVAIDDVTADILFGTGLSPTGYFLLNSINAQSSQGPLPVNPNDVRFIVNTQESAHRLGRPYGNVGRNTFRGDNTSIGNFGIFKNLQLSENLKMQFRVEFFNVFNHPNKGVPDPFIDDAGVGFADVNENSGGTRSIQFGLKLIF